MKRYCVFLTIDLKSVQDFRRRFDPLAMKVQPHVTIIHPFESDQPLGAIITHLTNTFQLKNAAFAIEKPVWTEGNISIPVINDELQKIRLRFYSDILKPFQETKYGYSPHITVGKYTTEAEKIEQQRIARDWKFGPEGTFQTLVLEKILEDESSKIELEIPAF
jgi:2'-5' RNA ligase